MADTVILESRDVETMFEHLRSQRIESLNIEAQEYRHRITGARHLHLAAQDSNNVFVVAFITPPRDSTGVAHILEHTVLCGSRRFPVRDPFFLMTRRSLNTFMNAFTASDWTAYPFASQNRKDFNNLLQVYLDAVFFPELNELDFAQEGYHLEFEAPFDPTTDLVYKGVVYNEMKGAMSAPNARLAQALSAELFPTTPYHYNSGGEPEVIPTLTYQQLKAFHTEHYHPSNAFFATYGDLDVVEHQAHLHEWALRYFEAEPRDLRVPDEQRYTSPRSVTLPYALEEETRNKTHIVLGWLLCRTTDLKEILCAHLLAGILLDHSASPLRHALETCPLGAAPSELCGLEGATREASFVCGLEGSDPEHAEAVEKLILGVLEEVAERGVPRTMADAVLHQMELSQREIRGGDHPYGLQLLDRAIPAALHGGDPIAWLHLDPVLEDLRGALEQPDFIQSLTRRSLLGNPHRVRVVMVPDKTLSARQQRATRLLLARLKSSLSAPEKARLVEQATALQARQNELNDPDILPKVGLEDVPPDLRIPEGQKDAVGGIPVSWYRQGTNGLVYQSVVAELPVLTPEQTELLDLYCAFLTEVGCGARDYLEVQAWQAAVSGGIGAQVAVCATINEVQAIHASFRLGANGLVRNQEALARLLRKTFHSARFDELPRLRELVAQLCAAREAAVTDQGHWLAMLAAGSGLGPAAFLHHQWDGLQGLKRLKALDKAIEAEASLAEFADRLAYIHEQMIQAPHQLLVVGEARRQDAMASALSAAWQERRSRSTRSEDASGAGMDQERASRPVISTTFRASPVIAAINQAWVTSTEVNFCAKAYPTVAADHPDAPALLVLGRFLQNGYLHRAIREQGGAYGSGAGYDADTGAFRFFSYRDPRLAETLEEFDASLRWLQRGRHEYHSLEEAILGVIRAIDRPGSPAGEAIKAFMSSLNGRTPDYLRRLRQRVLKVTTEDLKRAAETYLTFERANTAVISNLRTLERYRPPNFEVLVL